jgi:hypothetical protein
MVNSSGLQPLSNKPTLFFVLSLAFSVLLYNRHPSFLTALKALEIKQTPISSL